MTRFYSLRPSQAFAVGVLAFAIAGAADARPPRGQIFTVSEHGTPLRIGNTRAMNGEVYLAVGPSNAPACDSGGLSDGSYYYQVTDSSGRRLVSPLPLSERRLEVQGGVIAAVTANVRGSNTACGSLTVRLMDNTALPAGQPLYRVAVVRVADYERVCGRGVDCGLRGFHPRDTRSRLFQIRSDSVGVGTIEVYKFYDANGDARFDEGDLDLPEWRINLYMPNADRAAPTGPDGVTTFTLIPGVYSVAHPGTRQTNWVSSTTIYRGHDGSPTPVTEPIRVRSGQRHTVAFGSYCTVPTGHPTWFWSEPDGQALIGANDLGALVALHLRNHDGSDFDPTSNLAVATWLGADAQQNAANVLSKAVSAVRLSVLNGSADGAARVLPENITIDALTAQADASLAADGYTPPDDPNAVAQHRLAQRILELTDPEGKGGLLSPTPCPYTTWY